MNKRIGGKIVMMCGLLALALVAGSLAYWNYTSEIENPFDTGKYGSTVTEDFVPEDGHEWQPGVDVNKDVYAINTGDIDLIVRARLDETWTYKSASEAYKDSKAEEYDVYTTAQADANDGLTAEDGSVVEKKFNASSDKWIDGGDGWYYYAENLAAGETSDKWLDSVELLDDADMGKMKTTYYVTASEDAANANWFTYDRDAGMPDYIDAKGTPCAKDAAGAQKVLHNKTETKYEKDDLIGYSNSNYVCKVTIQTIQPTQEAIDAVFGGGNAFAAPAGTAWVLKDN